MPAFTVSPRPCYAAGMMDIETLSLGVKAGERRALARAITLVESGRADHRLAAEAMINTLLPGRPETIRIGISGVPGAGKSTFIEAFGLSLIEKGHRVAVLAIDPSSRRGGGSILGDKTRMSDLARHEQAYVRPTPSGGTLGGVARRTREAMLLCEAAGFDTVIIETVGVGQSEGAVADLTDMFLLLLLPAGGDELQGIKRGVMELADLILVNKADGDLEAAALRTALDYRNALHLVRAKTTAWQTPVLAVSALNGKGIDEAWAMVEKHRQALDAVGERLRRRGEQARAALWTELGEGLLDRLRASPAVKALLPEIEGRVMAGREVPATAARALLAGFLAGQSGEP